MLNVDSQLLLETIVARQATEPRGTCLFLPSTELVLYCADLENTIASMSKSAIQSLTLVGGLAPEFELTGTTSPGRSDKVIRLEDYRGRWLILMFYPRDFSLVCPTELSAMNTRYDEFIELGAEVIAVSTDSIESHKRWLSTPKAEGGLGTVKFPLASDTTGDVVRAYHACLDPQGLALRGLFIIDPNSVIQYQVVQNLSVGRRTDEILRVLSALQTGGLCAENFMPGRETMDVSQLRPGNIVSNFRIEEKLGDGGFGSVYLAHDRVLERKVALKILNRTEDWSPSLLNEARAVAALNHRNVCTVYGIDDAEGISMIVMEYIDGRPLTRLFEEGPTPTERVMGLAHQIAAGMDAAHGAGIVHGDLKLSNILLTDDDTVKILDFGLAVRYRALSSSADHEATRRGTDRGAIVGTPAYMSPEQADGNPVTKASDVFSFGLNLYELLTGARAFDGPNMLQILNQIRSINPQEFGDAVDGPFKSLLPRMLIADPAKRTITMGEVAEILN